MDRLRFMKLAWILGLMVGLLAFAGLALAAGTPISADHVKTYTAGEFIPAGKFVMVAPDNRIYVARDPGYEWRWNLDRITYPYISGMQLYAAGKALVVQFGKEPKDGSRLIFVSMSGMGAINFAQTNFDKGLISRFVLLPTINTILADCYVDTLIDGKRYVGDCLIAGTITGTQVQWGPLYPFPASYGRFDRIYGTDGNEVIVKNYVEVKRLVSGTTQTVNVHQIFSIAVQGTTLKFGTPLDIPSATPGGIALSGSRVLLLYDTPWMGRVITYMAVATANETVINTGGWTKLDGPTGEEGIRLDTDRVLIRQGGANFMYEVPGTVPKRIGVLPLTGPGVKLPLYPLLVNNQFILLDAARKSLRTLTVSSGTITADAPVTLASRATSLSTDAMSSVMLAGDLLLTLTSSDTFNGLAVINTKVRRGTMDSWVGVAEQNTGMGYQCPVTIGGGITNRFKSLQPGARYYLTDMGLKAWADINGMAGLEDKLSVGRAISTTDLMIEYAH